MKLYKIALKISLVILAAFLTVSLTTPPSSGKVKPPISTSGSTPTRPPGITPIKPAGSTAISSPGSGTSPQQPTTQKLPTDSTNSTLKTLSTQTGNIIYPSSTTNITTIAPPSNYYNQIQPCPSNPICPNLAGKYTADSAVYESTNVWRYNAANNKWEMKSETPDMIKLSTNLSEANVFCPNMCTVTRVVEPADGSLPITKFVGAVCPPGYSQAASYNSQKEVIIANRPEPAPFPILSFAEYDDYVKQGYECIDYGQYVSSTDTNARNTEVITSYFPGSLKPYGGNIFWGNLCKNISKSTSSDPLNPANSAQVVSFDFYTQPSRDGKFDGLRIISVPYKGVGKINSFKLIEYTYLDASGKCDSTKWVNNTSSPKFSCIVTPGKESYAMLTCKSTSTDPNELKKPWAGRITYDYSFKRCYIKPGLTYGVHNTNASIVCVRHYPTYKKL